MKEIPLTQGFVAIVDDCDFERLTRHKWRIWRSVDGRHMYARRSTRCAGKKGEEKMHRAVVDAPEGIEVDHRNGNGLDNRRDNLRIASSGQNKQNKKEVRGEIPFKGVSLLDGEIIARIKTDRKTYHIGKFATAEDAARAYDARAIQIFGEFACTNKMMGLLT